jgi:poly(ADP-ribose) glycohydrolase ARH3
MSDNVDRIAGSLLAAACGDGLGAVFEGQHDLSPTAVRDHLRQSTGLRWTDDTSQMIVLARHVASHGGRVDQDAFAGELAAAWAADPDRGYGGGARRLLAQINSGARWQEAAAALFGGQGSHGNGAAMRVAPIGLLPAELAEIDHAARASAAVSHAHPVAQDGAAVQAVAVAVALRHDPAEPFDGDAFCALVAHFARTPQLQAALARIPALTAQNTSASQLAAELGHDATALGSVPAALAVFLQSPDQPAQVIERAICLGGDTDTIAAMAAAISGAYTGRSALPTAWLTRLERTDELHTAAERVAGLWPAR